MASSAALRKPLRGPSFVAIDFETANQERQSACAIGLVQVVDGRIVRRLSRLIRPPSPRFEFTYIHGIDWRKVADQPSFSELWPLLAPLLDGADFLAAHNASFDRSVLMACCALGGLPVPALPFECTVKLARSSWGLRPTTLQHVADHLGIPLRHHDAGSDAEACARIVLSAWAS